MISSKAGVGKYRTESDKAEKEVKKEWENNFRVDSCPFAVVHQKNNQSFGALPEGFCALGGSIGHFDLTRKRTETALLFQL